MSPSLEKILQEIEQLTPVEQMEVLGHLANRAKQYIAPAKSVRRWNDLKGMSPYPLQGEGAQAWVSQARRESDEHRERALRG